MPIPYTRTEGYLAEPPAIQLFAELGWKTISAMEEVFGSTGTLKRETKSEVVLRSQLRGVLGRLDPGLPVEAISQESDELTRDQSAMSLAAAIFVLGHRDGKTL